MSLKKSTFLNAGVFKTYAIIMVYVLLIGIFMITAPKAFTDYKIYLAFLSTIPFSLIMAIGLTFVIIAGEIDLSFPSSMALSGFVFMYTYIHLKNSIVALLACIAVGIIIGLINGIIVAKLKVPSIVATLATSFIWAGLAVVISGGIQINIPVSRGSLFYNVLVGRVAGLIPAQSLWAFGLAIIMALILNRNRFGEHVMFIGDNRETSKMLGVDVDRTLISVFILNGALASFSSVLLGLEYVTWWPTQGPGFLLITIAAVFIGGTSIYGGEGTILGTVIGAFIVGSITAGVVASGAEGSWTQLIVGLVMLLAVVFNTLMRNRKS
jgi:simple sugar transport system permease protein